MRQRHLTLAFPLTSTVVVHVRSPVGRLLTPIARFYGRLRVEPGRAGLPDVVISIERRGATFFVTTPFTSYRLEPVGAALRLAYFHGTCLDSLQEAAWAGSNDYLRRCDGIDEPDPTLSHVCGLIERVLLSTVCDFAGGLECFHAAAVARGDKCLVIAGESDSGKTTTALALCGEGWKLLNDDTSFYDTQTGQAYPLNRRPVVRNRRTGGIDLYSYLDFKLCKEKKNRLQQSVKAEYRLSDRGARVTDVLFLSGRGRDCRTSAFSPALGLLRLARASCARRDDPRRDLERLATALAGVGWWECCLGTPGESARSITSILFPTECGKSEEVQTVTSFAETKGASHAG
jgi:hypothetical protein